MPMPCLGPGLHAGSGSGHCGGRDDTGSALGTPAGNHPAEEELEAPPTGRAVVDMGRDRRQKCSGRGGFGLVGWWQQSSEEMAHKERRAT